MAHANEANSAAGSAVRGVPRMRGIGQNSPPLLTMDDRKSELVEELQGMLNVPDDLVQVIASCARIISKVTERDDADDMPNTWLAWNWHTVMVLLPQCATPELSRKAFRTLRSIALCMRATGFPDSHLFIEASGAMMGTVDKLNALETELLQLNGESAQ